MEDNHEQTWGFFKWRPNRFKFFNSSKWLLCAICMYIFSNTLVIQGLFTASIPTIERRFSLTSAQMGFITGGFDIAACVAMLPVSYFGVRNRPRSLSIGMLTMGIGYIVFVLPHFIAEKYQPVPSISLANATINTPLCGTSNRVGCKAGDSSGGSNLHFALFLLGMIVSGFGCTPMIAIGIPFIDDSVQAKASPLYIAAVFTFAIVGVGVGYAMSNILLRIFVHPGTNVDLKPGDTQWVGAWWIGFLVGCVLAFLVSIVLASLPKKIAVSKPSINGNNEENQALDEKSLLPGKKFFIHLKDLVFQHISYTFISLWISLQFFAASSSFTFIPKISSVQFQIPANLTAIYYGIPTVISGITGNLLGAWILKRWKGSGVEAFKICIISTFLALLIGLHLFISCDTPPVIGINAIRRNSSGMNIYSTCQQSCGCRNEDFLPVCANSESFLNPCYAGCSVRKSTRLFQNCSCIQGTANEVKLGACKKDCGYKPVLFFILAGLTSIVTTPATTPAGIATLRSVPVHLKSFAIGTQWMVARVLGSIPGPILVGYLIDTSCIKWEYLCDGSRGSCKMYDHRKMSKRVGVCILLIRFLALISIIIALWQFKDHNNQHDLEIKNKRESDGVKPPSLLSKIV